MPDKENRLAEFLKWRQNKPEKASSLKGVESENNRNPDPPAETPQTNCLNQQITTRIEEIVDQKLEEILKGFGRLVPTDITNGRSSQSLIALGMAYRDQGETSKAIQKFKEALELIPASQVELYAKIQRMVLELSAPQNAAPTEWLSIKKLTEDRMVGVLNSGSVKEIKTLKMIGSKRAELILSDREMNGSFSGVSLQ